MARMKEYLLEILEKAEAAFPGSVAEVDYDHDVEDEILIKLRVKLSLLSPED